MDNQDLSIQICITPEELKASRAAEMVILEGLGNNILEHLGNVELGKVDQDFPPQP